MYWELGKPLKVEPSGNKLDRCENMLLKGILDPRPFFSVSPFASYPSWEEQPPLLFLLSLNVLPHYWPYSDKAKYHLKL